MIAVVGVAQAGYQSGAVSTHEKFLYGKFVARMKAPDRKGTVASFFTYWDGPNFSPAGWNELDIEIVPSVEDNPFSTNVIYGDGKQKEEEHEYLDYFDPHDEWHVYEMEWTPEYISFTIDGREMRYLD
jgi:beta-glucanase (GH16 family)